MSNAALDHLNRRGGLLLEAIARAPANRTLSTEFNTLFYPVVLRYVKRRHGSLRASVAALTRNSAAVPELDRQDIEEAAHATAWLALEGARAGAHRFEASRGTAVAWV